MKSSDEPIEHDLLSRKLTKLQLAGEHSVAKSRQLSLIFLSEVSENQNIHWQNKNMKAAVALCLLGV